jgi:beta-galactosidase
VSQANQSQPSRRQVLQGAGLALAGGVIGNAAPADRAAPASSLRLSEGWECYRGGLGGIWEVWRGKAAAAGTVDWEKIALPHCFNGWDSVDPDQAYYEGPAWYRATLAHENPDPGGRTLLHFEGAGQKSEVFIGLESVARHVGGYDEFTVDITDAAAREGKSVRLAVCCDNSRDLQSIPSDQSDFTRYGGLYRDVHLVYRPALAIERLQVEASAADAREARVRVRLQLANPTALHEPVKLSARILDPSGTTVAEWSGTSPAWDGAREVVSFSLPNPALWSPAAPSLYRCQASVETTHGAHAAEERFGVRWFDFPEHGVFSLNGSHLFLRGTQRHQDHAGVGAAMPDDLTRREMRLMKEMGANFVRLGHYQQSRLVLDLCDELGLLVWEEIPWCRGGLGGGAYQDEARRMLRNMIDQHRNHPSVVFWGVGNEIDWPGDFPVFDRDAIRNFAATLHGIAHEADPSRMTALRRCSFASDITDVYSPSIWAGWYSGRYTEYKAATQKEVGKERRMLHIEWGGDSLAGRHAEDPGAVVAAIATGQGVDEKAGAFLPSGGVARASRDGDWSETYICDLFDWYLKEQETMPWLAGSAQWCFKDFATPLRPENPVPRVNQKGLLERDLTPKEGYYVFQSYWSAEPMARIYAHSWPVRWGKPGEQRLVKVYSNCPTAELFHNGHSCGVRRRNSRDFPAAGLRWGVAFDSGENHLLVVARKDGHEVRDEIRFLYQDRPWGSPARFTLAEAGRAGDLVTVAARLVDAAGLICLDAHHSVRFRLAGDGELVQNLGIAAGSRKVELANGRAVARVRRKGGGTSILSVSAEGVPTAVITIQS